MANKFFYTTNITLVCEVKKYKCLYDFTRSDYTNRKMVEDAWAEIGKKLGVSAYVAKTRWVNLRTVYVRRRGKIRKSGSVIRTPYYLDKYMRFLIPYLKRKPLQRDRNLVDVGKIEQEDLDVKPFIEEVSRVDQEVMNDIANGESNNKEAIFEPVMERGTVPQFLKVEEHPDRAFLENARKMFLLSLLPEVNELTEYQFKIFKRKVLALIDEMESSNYLTPVSISTSYNTSF